MVDMYVVIFARNVYLFSVNSIVFGTKENAPVVYAKYSMSKKTALILEHDQMQIYMKYAKAKKLNYVKGKEIVFVDSAGISVLRIGVGEAVAKILTSRLKGLISSGIYQLWYKWYLIKLAPQWSENGLYQLLRKEEIVSTTTKPLSMNTKCFSHFIFINLVMFCQQMLLF